VQINRKWGFVDRYRKLLFQLDDVIHTQPFRNGLGGAGTSDFRWGWVDESGKYVWRSEIPKNAGSN
jgi:hypothetical protein